MEDFSCSADYNVISSRFCSECGMRIKKLDKISLDSMVPNIDSTKWFILGFADYQLPKTHIIPKDKTFRLVLERLFYHYSELDTPPRQINIRAFRVFKLPKENQQNKKEETDEETQNLQSYFEKLIADVGEIYIIPRPEKDRHIPGENYKALVKTRQEVLSFEKAEIVLGKKLGEIYAEESQINGCRIFVRRKIEYPYYSEFLTKLRYTREALDALYQKRTIPVMDKFDFLMLMLGIDSGKI